MLVYQLSCLNILLFLDGGGGVRDWNLIATHKRHYVESMNMRRASRIAIGSNAYAAKPCGDSEYACAQDTFRTRRPRLAEELAGVSVLNLL